MTAKTIIVCGYGPGISSAVATKFGAAGFQVALVARNADKLESAIADLEQRGVKAAAFPTDLADPSAAKALVKQAQRLGPVAAIHWNAYTSAAGDIMRADAAALHTAFDVGVTSLILVIQEALADLKASNGAVLVTNGGFALFDPQVDAMAVRWNAMDLAIANAAKHKLTGLLIEKLRADEITVGEVVVLGIVKGTTWDTGNATIDPHVVADKFWEIYSNRTSQVATVS